MISEGVIKKQTNLTLEKTNFQLGERYQGKVRDVYSSDKQLIMITTDRISAFDHVLGTIPFKGEILNQLAVFWFNKTKDIVRNHIIDVPDPSVMVVHKCTPIPIEVVVRGYITGSLWRDYESGKKEMYGLRFNGLRKNQKFDAPILTPCTKEAYGHHDLPISKQEILKKSIISKEVYEKIEKIAVELFERGTEVCAKNGLILVDTKYEFGLVGKDIVLMDEIHTPDSSRFWLKGGYEERFEKGEEQIMLDKENIRQWLIERGFSGEGQPPKLTEEIRTLITKKYVVVYEQITGSVFTAEAGSVKDRIEMNLKKKGYLKE